MLTHLDAAVACGSRDPGTASGCAPHELPWPQWHRKDHHVSAPVAGVRESAGHSRLGRQTAADTSMATGTSLAT
jgi:hypothetical protein